MYDSSPDSRIRSAAFEYLKELVQKHGELLKGGVLQKGFTLGDRQVHLKSIQGIFRPRGMEFPLSITTAAPEPDRERPYDDHFLPDGTISYHYRGTDPAHHQNVWLRHAMERRIPLIYFFGVERSLYFPAWPVFIVGEDQSRHSFRVLVDDADYIAGGLSQVSDEDDEGRRSYVTVEVRQRLHQKSFRQRVLRAYRTRCAMCRLRHERLLDAAHIVPDRDPDGLPAVTNGLALCKIHHAAFDEDLIGIRPDHVIQVRRDILEDRDGPMLVHGLQALHGSRIVLPRRPEQHPSPTLLDRRFTRFLVEDGQRA